MGYGQSKKPHFCSFSILIFQNTAVLFLLAHCTEGQSQVIGPLQPIVAVVGDDIILPCHLEPAVDAGSTAVEWTRPDLKPRFVHVWRAGQKLELDDQNPSYRGRTSLFIDKLRQGNISLKLSKVKLSDKGKYKCYVPILNRNSVFELVVGAVSPPVIGLAGIDSSSGRVVLQCESKGWYPEPEVLWLDSEGNLLSAGPTETVRGPDDLYTVSSRVTVEKRHSNRFTCRVQQNNINQTRETQIEVTAECFTATSCSAALVSIILIIFLGLICAAAFVVWKWRQNKIKETKMHHEREIEEREREQLLAENKKKEDLEKKAKLDEELQKKEEEQKDLEQVINVLMVQKNELNKLTEQLECQNKDMEREKEGTVKKVQSVDKETESDRVKGYLGLKEIILETKQQLLKRKQEHQHLYQNTQALLKKTDDVIKRVVDRKKEIENCKEKISLQLKETEK